MIEQVKERLEDLRKKKQGLQKELREVEEEIRSLVKKSLLEDYRVVEGKSLVRYRGKTYLALGVYEMETSDRKPWLVGRLQKGKRLGAKTLLYDEWELIDI